jgi:hypothetical protein
VEHLICLLLLSLYIFFCNKIQWDGLPYGYSKKNVLIFIEQNIVSQDKLYSNRNCRLNLIYIYIYIKIWFVLYLMNLVLNLWILY